MSLDKTKIIANYFARMWLTGFVTSAGMFSLDSSERQAYFEWGENRTDSLGRARSEGLFFGSYDKFREVFDAERSREPSLESLQEHYTRRFLE